MTLLDLILIAAAVALSRLIIHALGAPRRRQEAREREYLGTMTRLTWMLVNERPSKVVYFTKAQVDGSIDVPHLQLELTPNGYALKALDAPSQDATSCIEVRG